MGGQQQGTVTALDRANNRLRATLDGGAQITATYLSNAMPWPLATATFTNQGGNQWLCTGPLGDERMLVHDDFLLVNHAIAVASLPVVPPGIEWWLTADSGAADPATIADAQGVIALTATYTSGALAEIALLSKARSGFPGFPDDYGSIALPPAPGAIWMSARWRLTDTGQPTYLGLRNQLTLADVFLYQDSVNFALRTNPDGISGNTTVIQGTTPAAGRWFVLDLVWGTGIAAMWIDGDGPYLTTPTSVPSTPLDVFMVQQDSVGGTTSYFDWVRVEAVSPVHDPATL